jgi:hypothetical protein
MSGGVGEGGEDVVGMGIGVGGEGCSSQWASGSIACGGTSGYGGLGCGSGGTAWTVGGGVATCGATTSCCAGFRHQ